jgi:hypothetical protein
MTDMRFAIKSRYAVVVVWKLGRQRKLRNAADWRGAVVKEMTHEELARRWKNRNMGDRIIRAIVLTKYGLLPKRKKAL